MAREIFVCLLLAGAKAAQVGISVDPSQPRPHVPIIRQINQANNDGSYAYGYEAGDGTFRLESRDAHGNVNGKYGFVDEFGILKVTRYSANGVTGYTATSEFLPKSRRKDTPVSISSSKITSKISKDATNPDLDVGSKLNDGENQVGGTAKKETQRDGKQKHPVIPTNLVPPSSLNVDKSIPKPSNLLEVPDLENLDQTALGNNQLDFKQHNPSSQHINGLLFIPHHVASIPSEHSQHFRSALFPAVHNHFATAQSTTEHNHFTTAQSLSSSDDNLIPLANPLLNPSNFLMLFPFPGGPPLSGDHSNAREFEPPFDGGNSLFFLPINNRATSQTPQR